LCRRHFLFDLPSGLDCLFRTLGDLGLPLVLFLFAKFEVVLLVLCANLGLRFGSLGFLPVLRNLLLVENAFAKALSWCSKYAVL